MKNIENLKFCYERILNLKTEGASKAVAFRSKYWSKNQSIKVYFMGGSNSQISEMKSVINELVAPLSLSVEYVGDISASDIRIDFKEGYGSWSYLGTDCKYISKAAQTLNIGWSGRDVMFHEFGHALNLAHEHQNPKGGVVWDEAQVIQDLSGAPNYWSVEEIRHNVLNKLDSTKVDSTEFDGESMMLYYFPNTWTIGNFQTNSNLYPSKKDLDFLIEKYGSAASVEVIEPTIDLKKFIAELFPTDYRLEQLTEEQLMVVAKGLDMEASVDDLKKDTIANIREIL